MRKSDAWLRVISLQFYNTTNKQTKKPSYKPCIPLDRLNELRMTRAPFIDGRRSYSGKNYVAKCAGGGQFGA